jgi:hypothetical protein
VFEKDQELPSLAAARDEALQFARQINAELDAPERALVEVADERGSTLWTVQLSEPIREVSTCDQRLALRRLSMRRIIARHTNVAALRA